MDAERPLLQISVKGQRPGAADGAALRRRIVRNAYHPLTHRERMAPPIGPRAESADGTRHAHHRPPPAAHGRPEGHPRRVRGRPGPRHPALDDVPLALPARARRELHGRTGPRGLGGRLDVHLRRSSSPKGRNWWACSASRCAPWRRRDRLLGARRSTAATATSPRPSSPRPLGLHHLAIDRWNGAPRSATAPPARWPNAPASPSRAPCARAIVHKGVRRDCWVGSLLPSDLGCRRRRRTCPQPAGDAGLG